MPLWEACVENYREAVQKEKLGAHRIELCSNLHQGGTTPSYGTIKTVLRDIQIPVMVMIRPRGGDFHFSRAEVDIMKEDIQIAKRLNARGVVLGAIKNGEIDMEVTEELVAQASPLEITFHMAFEEVENKYRAIDKMIDLQINRILTRGGAESALKGIDSLRDFIAYAQERIIIMPGKGITRKNRDHIARETGARELHGTKIV